MSQLLFPVVLFFFFLNILVESLIFWELIGTKSKQSYGSAFIDVFVVNLLTTVLIFVATTFFGIGNFQSSVWASTSLRSGLLTYPMRAMGVLLSMVILDTLLLLLYYKTWKRNIAVEPKKLFLTGIAMNAPVLVFAVFLLFMSVLLTEFLNLLKFQ